jgi:hypothetical protein
MPRARHNAQTHDRPVWQGRRLAGHRMRGPGREAGEQRAEARPSAECDDRGGLRGRAAASNQAGTAACGGGLLSQPPRPRGVTLTGHRARSRPAVPARKRDVPGSWTDGRPNEARGARCLQGWRPALAAGSRCTGPFSRRAGQREKTLSQRPSLISVHPTRRGSRWRAGHRRPRRAMAAPCCPRPPAVSWRSHMNLPGCPFSVRS